MAAVTENRGYRIELRNYLTPFTIQEILNPYVVHFQFTVSRAGGAVEFSMTLRDTNAKGLGNFSSPRRIDLWVRESGTWNRWFSGIPLSVRPIWDASGVRLLQVQGRGYIAQLEWVRVNKTYTAQTIHEIATDIIANYIVPNSHCTIYTGVAIAGAGYTVQNIVFEQDALSCLAALAEMLGNVDWGVHSFSQGGAWIHAVYFAASQITELITTPWLSPYHCEMIDLEFDSMDLRNRIIVEGGFNPATGAPVTATANDVASQNTYGIRSGYGEDGSIENATDAAQYGAEYVSAVSHPENRIGLRVRNVTSRYESIPIGPFRLYDFWSTESPLNTQAWQASQISYELDEAGKWTVFLNLGNRMDVRPMPSRGSATPAGALGSAQPAPDLSERATEADVNAYYMRMIEEHNQRYKAGSSWGWGAHISAMWERELRKVRGRR